jgi:uncharacterized membrane protein
VSLYDWLVFLHVSGAFLLLGGAIAAGLLNISALRGGRTPSEVALLFGLVRIAVVAIVLGSLLTLVFGLWLVHEAPWRYGYGDGWIVGSIILWVVGVAAGNAGGRRDEQTAKLARQLAAEGDSASAELAARLRDPVTLTLSYGSGLVILAVLAMMIWKPGAG